MEYLKGMDGWFINLLAVGGSIYFIWTMKRRFNTDYRTQTQCDDCSVRASMNVIRSLVIELAIKAGVPDMAPKAPPSIFLTAFVLPPFFIMTAPPFLSFNSTVGSVVIILTIGLNWPMICLLKLSEHTQRSDEQLPESC